LPSGGAPPASTRALTANRPQTSAAPAALLAKFAIIAAPLLG